MKLGFFSRLGVFLFWLPFCIIGGLSLMFGLIGTMASWVIFGDEK